MHPLIHSHPEDMTTCTCVRLPLAVLTCKLWYTLAKNFLIKTEVYRSLDPSYWTEQVLSSLYSAARIVFLVPRQSYLYSQHNSGGGSWMQERLLQTLQYAQQCKELLLIGVSPCVDRRYAYPVLSLPNLARSLTMLVIDHDITALTAEGMPILPMFNIWSVLEQLPHLRHFVLTNADLSSFDVGNNNGNTIGNSIISTSTSTSKSAKITIKLETLVLTRFTISQEELDALLARLCTPALRYLRLLPHVKQSTIFSTAQQLDPSSSLRGIPYHTVQLIAALSPHLEAVELDMLLGEGRQALGDDDNWSEDDNHDGENELSGDSGQETAACGRMFRSLVGLHIMFPKATWKAVHVLKDLTWSDTSFTYLYTNRDLSVLDIQAIDRRDRSREPGFGEAMQRTTHYLYCSPHYTYRTTPYALLSFLASPWSTNLVEINMTSVPLGLLFLIEAADSSEMLNMLGRGHHHKGGYRLKALRVLRVSAENPSFLQVREDTRLRLLFSFIIVAFPFVQHLEIHKLVHDEPQRDFGFCLLSRLQNLETLIIKTSSIFRFPVVHPYHAGLDHHESSPSSMPPIPIPMANGSRAEWEPLNLLVSSRTEPILQDFNWMVEHPVLSSSTSLPTLQPRVKCPQPFFSSTWTGTVSRLNGDYVSGSSRETLILGNSLEVCRAIASADTGVGYFRDQCSGQGILWPSHDKNKRHEEDGYRYPGCRWTNMRLFRIEVHSHQAKLYASRIDSSIRLARQVRPDIQFEVVSFQVEGDE
ncbi:hypothetical protein BGW42_004952 [Actinomortierella wolfii]|nr:hypothetical protein BGW42_004952 [Actinomortierella wolfii]